MNRKIGLCILVILTIATGVYASPPNVEWIKTIDNLTTECSTGKCSQIIETNDGGYLVAGKYADNIDTSQLPTKKLYIVKTDSNGNIEWNKIIDMQYNVMNVLAQQTLDNGYVIATSLRDDSPYGLFQIWIIKLGTNGNEEFKIESGASTATSITSARSIRQTPDEGYILSDGQGVAKLYPNGNGQWSRNYYTGHPPDYMINDALPITDGYILTGRKDCAGRCNSQGWDLWTEKLNMNGDIIWEKLYNIPDYVYEEGWFIERTSDGNYIISGIVGMNRADYGPDILLLKINENGDKIWYNAYESPDIMEYFMSARENPDNGYTIVSTANQPLSGDCYASEGNCDILLINTDANGNKLWERTIGGPHIENYVSFDQTFDNKIIIATTEYTNCNKFPTRFIKMSYTAISDFPYPDTCAVESMKPITTIQFSGVSGNNDYFTSDVQVTLTATDNEGGSGIAKTEYTFDNTNWNTYSSPFMITDEGIKTVYYRSIDNVNNIESTKTVSVKIDKSIPIVAATSDRLPDFNGWYNKSVTISFTGTDGISGIANCDSEIIYNGPDSTGTSVSGICKDNAGNTGTDTYSFKYDSTKPAINIIAPVGNYVQNQVVVTDYNCIDTISEVATCIGPIQSGSNIDTSSAGPQIFAVNAEDNAGNSNIVTTNYDIATSYIFTGFFQPVDNLPVLNIAKSGSAIPIKFSLNGDQGLNIFAEGYPASRMIDCTSGVTDVIEATATAGQSGLSYNVSTDQYTYIWKTDKSWKGTCRQLTLKLDDDTEHSANFKFN